MLDKTPNHASAPLHTGPHTYTDAYHLRLGASATRYRDRENISQQIAPPTNATTALTRFKDAGAIIAQFVTAARTMAEAENYQGSDARQVRLDAATKAGDHIAIGGQKLKKFYQDPQNDLPLFPDPLAILTVVREEVPSYPDSVQKAFFTAIAGALQK